MNLRQATSLHGMACWARLAVAIGLYGCSFDPRPYQAKQVATHMCPSGRCAMSDSATAGRAATEPMSVAEPTTIASNPPPQCLPTVTAEPGSCDHLCCGAKDGCCPNACSALDDPDCSANCGDGVVEALETCDTGSRTALCLKSCDDGDRCTTDAMLGSASNCNVRCSNARILVPSDADGCCPAGATATNDSDCPPDPACGNGIVEPDEECDGGENCASNCRQRFATSLMHRYSFADVGRSVHDSVGGADGRVVGTMLSGADLNLDGTRSHVVLPKGLLSPLQSATIEAWVTWRGGSPGQRLFEISSTGGDPERNQGRAFWNLSPMDEANQLSSEMNFTPDFDPANTYFARAAALPTNEKHHVAVSFDGVAHALRLYIDGRLATRSDTAEGSLSQIRDENVWIGLSQRDNDPGMQGTVHEFRVYGAVLDDAQVARSYELGPDPDLLMP